MAKKKAENTAEIGFEEQIWKAADKLRGNMDASEYKNVVLGLIFLKYISDKFEQRYQELVEEGDGFEEDRDEYTYKNIFFVPKEARWQTVAAAAHAPEIGKVIDEAMRQIEAENDKLKNILPKNFARQELDKRRLGEVVDLFTNVQMADKGDTRDILGRTYEYCLAKFAEAEGKNAGEFYTPACIVRTLVEIIEPYHGRVYDPCCGSGGMFVQSADFVKRHQGNINDLSIFGQESNPTTWKMAMMNLAIRGIDANLGSFSDDTFFNDIHKNERFDFVLANPPFNMKDWGGDKLKDDSRWKYGIPPEGNANFAWVQHMVHHLNRTGRMGMVLANGSLSSQTGGEGDIRKALVEADLIEGIVAMPPQLFYSTQIPVCLWILNKQKSQPGKMLFIDAREMGTMVSRKLREFTGDDIAKVSKAFDTFRDGEIEEEKGFSAVATLEDVVKQDFILTPGRYVGIADAPEDDEPFDEKMARLTGELAKCFEESNRLQEQIKKNLEAIGYGL
ncbi:type I restriction-modification system subunit M [Slackia piriformis]|uniref:type I restriction-modification system subunit M n=1 Tax=Slackia piriformis TaxID=626934 RepID=UPI0032C00360